MKIYGKIGDFRLLNIRVIKENKVLFEGMVEQAPSEIKSLSYYKVDMISPITVYCY